ncbi:AimR family lysis-lysogeny pheromone receptor [Bacillus horti]|uniref:Transcriptional regulator with XRE-family HTH domain n=1 Tax=Caldalkalibacillus horti TaxID=77523 RepID=A0ABT9W1P7_9BACI|nr:AimR family lysis-lysogeny pheromone receptor [Bacillus horti]MDQ0167188.1 transcriptional regulator with XRE-family HTH domain [Bacillus horti]
MLQERILKTLESRDNLDQRKLSRIAGVSESTISRYLHGFDEINFESVLAIVKHLFPDGELSIMAEYVLTQKSRNARFALEYCWMNDLDEQLDYLIQSLATAVNPLDKEWAGMYELLKIRKSKAFTPVEMLKKVEVFKPKELEMDLLRVILKGYIYVDLQDFHSLSSYIPLIEEDVEKVKSSFIRDSFKVRIGLLMNYVSLLKNDIIKAREYSTWVVEQNYYEKKKGSAYYQLGYSYLFTDYEKASDYFQRAFTLFTRYQKASYIEAVNRDVSFLNSYWKIDRAFTYENKDYQTKSDYLYYLIQKGDLTEARILISGIDVSALADYDKAFYYYHFGLIENDLTSFRQSVRWFKKIGDQFHLQLPLEELKKLKEDQLVLEIFAM